MRKGRCRGRRGERGSRAAEPGAARGRGGERPEPPPRAGGDEEPAAATRTGEARARQGQCKFGGRPAREDERGRRAEDQARPFRTSSHNEQNGRRPHGRRAQPEIGPVQQQPQLMQGRNAEEQDGISEGRRRSRRNDAGRPAEGRRAARSKAGHQEARGRFSAPAEGTEARAQVAQRPVGGATQAAHGSDGQSCRERPASPELERRRRTAPTDTATDSSSRGIRPAADRQRRRRQRQRRRRPLRRAHRRNAHHEPADRHRSRVRRTVRRDVQEDGRAHRVAGGHEGAGHRMQREVQHRQPTRRS